MIDKRKAYNNESISALKGADRVRKRPAVIFGSDGLVGCQHSFFEILSNAIDEAREGFGAVIEITKHADKSITVTDHGRGTPVDYNQKERVFNWKLIYCELYAGSKYNNNDAGMYAYSLGLNGLGCCATQYSSEYMDIEVIRDGFKYNLHFEKGVNKGGLSKEKTKIKETGTITKWKPDLQVFTDIDIPLEYLQDILKKQAVVNKGLKFTLLDEETNETFEYCYERGVEQYMEEIAMDKNFTPIVTFNKQTKGRDRADKPDYKVKFSTSFCFCNEINLIEYYHNSSYLEHGGSPDKAVKAAFAYSIDKFLKDEGKYTKNESKVSYSDIFDSLILVSNSFSTVTSYANQTKKSITNKFIQSAMTEYLKHELEIYFIENKAEALKIGEQILVNKRSS
jgi:DNA gyrase subunit B